MSRKGAGEGIDQDMKGRLAQLATRLSKRQTPLDPLIAFDTGGTQGGFSPQHGKTQGPLRSIVGSVRAMLARNTQSEAISRCKRRVRRPGIIRTFMIARNQVVKRASTPATAHPWEAPWPCGIRPVMLSGPTCHRPKARDHVFRRAPGPYE